MPDEVSELMVTDLLPRATRDDPRRARALNVIRKLLDEEIKKKGKPNFILVVLSHEDKFIYPGIKVCTYCGRCGR